MAYAPSWDPNRGDEAPAETSLPEEWATSYLYDPTIFNPISWMDRAAGGWGIDPSFQPALLTQPYGPSANAVVGPDSPMQLP
jgi:hypothetical protein